MKNKYLLSFLFVTMFAWQVWGQVGINFDFCLSCNSGQTLYYKITSNVEPYTAMLTHPSTANGTFAYNSYYGYTKPDGILIIPPTIVYDNICYTITSIDVNAFYNCSDLTSVSIPESITSIGAEAFYGCSGLTSVTILNSATIIESGAFSNCYNITEITMTCEFDGSANLYFTNNGIRYQVLNKDSVSVVSNAYSGDINIPGAVTAGNTFTVASIGDKAFYNSTGLTSVTIPNTVKSIGNSAFYNCSGLSSVAIPNSVTTIDNSAFNNCSGLTSITIPNSVIDIGNSTFYNCSGLTSVSIPESVSSIGGSTFYNCSNLTSITIPNSTTSIGNRAFYGCNNLELVAIPSSVTNVGSSAFTSNKTIFYCEAKNRPTGWSYNSSNKWNSGNGVVHWGVKAKLTDNIVYEVINDTIAPYHIGIYQYRGDSIQADIPSSITFDNDEYQIVSIAQNAFLGYDNLDYTTYGNAYYIGNNANPYLVLISAKNKKIASCDINSKCRFIYDAAFRDCINLTEISIPASVTGVGVDAFYGCSNLQKTEFASVDNLCSIRFGNQYSNPLFYTHHLFVNGDEITNVVITNTIKVIGDYTFYNCHYLNSVTISDSVKRIGKYAFYYCGGIADGNNPYVCGLKSISIPNSVKEIDNGAFANCIDLQKVEFSSIESLCNIRFGDVTANPLYYAHNLYITGEPTINLIIPQSVNSIGNYAFYNCQNIASLIISDSVKNIGREAFYGCSRLASIDIPNSVESIGNYAFYGCSGLKSLSYNSNIIGAHFNNISALESIFIGDSIKSIIGSEFNGCDNLVNVISMAAVPPSLTGDPYTYADTIWVPATSVNAYKAAPVWKRKEIMPLDYYSVSVMQNDTTRGAVCGDGNFEAKRAITIFALPADNYHFRAWSDGNTDNPRTIMLNNDMDITAIFEGDERTVRTEINDFGALSGDATYHYGDTAVITATALTGYHFVMWSDSVTSNPRTMIVTENSSFSALFEIDTYNIAATAVNGEVSGAAQYSYGESVTLTATANTGYHFVKWSDDVTTNPRTFSAESNLNITAIIEAHNVVTDAAIAATCTTTGLTEGKHCSACNEILVAQDTIDALGHTEVVDTAVAATCTATGLTEGKHCSVCNEIIVAQDTVAALGHTEVIDAGFAATCTEFGITDGKHCSVCNEVLVAQDTIAALGHTEVVDAAVAATCTATGLTEGSHCSVCGKVLVAQNEIPLAEHTAVVDAAVAATATATGLTEGSHCSVCGAVLVAQEVIPALGEQGGSNENNPGTTVAESAANNLLVYATGKTIVVENATEEIFVYNAMGALVGRGSAHNICTININTTGVYIVKTGGTVKRVMVK